MLHVLIGLGAGFLIGGFVVPCLVVRFCRPPRWVQEDWTNLLALFYAGVLILVGAIGGGLMGACLALHLR